MNHRPSRWCLLRLAVGLATALAAATLPAASLRELIEADWLKQAQIWYFARTGGISPTWADAAGAVDGVKDGKYGFHTAGNADPWWQVDLGEVVPIGRIVVYNRLDYAPGLHNADTMVILTSADGQHWTQVYDCGGRHFGGVTDGKPLTVDFPADKIRGRFVRLQIPSKQGILFHLDEVEIFRAGDLKTNIALHRPADQSSACSWSTSKATATPPREFPTAEVVEMGNRLAAELRGMGVDTSRWERDRDEILAQLKALSAAKGDSPIFARGRSQFSLAENGTVPLRKWGQSPKQCYLQARWAIRRLAFSNPLLRFNQLVFVKRFTQMCYPDICLNHMPWVSRPGGDICVLSNPFSADGTGQSLRPLLRGALGAGHVHGMDLWWDAGRVVFGYAHSKTGKLLFAWPPPHCSERYLAHKLRETEEPTHIFEIGIDGQGLRQLTNHNYWSDLDPTYLPSGDVAFVSERCGTSLQCNHDPHLDETSCNLYVMRPDGSNLHRLSANKDGDYMPHCLDDGTIGYTRWEYQDRGLVNIQSLWSIRPDGTWADTIFKQHLDNPWALEDVHSIPGSAARKLVAIAAGHHTLAAGPVVAITPNDGLNGSQAIRIVTPGVIPPEGGMSGTTVAEGGVRDDGGHYMTPWALSEKYFLVAYSYLKTAPKGYPDFCRGQDEKGYALYLIDVFGNKELLYRDEEISSFVPIPLRPRPRPPVLADQTDAAREHAQCVVSDVSYGVDGIDPKRIRYLRISQGVAWPYDRKHGGQRYESNALNTGLGWTPVRIIGTVPVEPDGSANFLVPTDEAVYFQLLDENQMELRRMRSFISFQPGEVRGCVGCHESRSAAPTAAPLSLALARQPSVPQPPPWGDRPLSFLRDVQPVFDRHCVSCHSGLKPAGSLDFSGGLLPGTKVHTTFGGDLFLEGHNRAYNTLITHNLVSYANKYDPASAISRPLAFGSHKSKLVEVLRSGTCSKRATLSPEDWLRLVTWIDANAPYHDAFINMRPEKPPYDLPADRQLLGKITAVHARRCTACHKADEVSRPDWIDLRRPQESRFLQSPLAREAGGSGKCGTAVYKDRNDPDYRTLRVLVDAAVKRAWGAPRRDLENGLGGGQ
jgi:hypothetical protein